VCKCCVASQIQEGNRATRKNSKTSYKASMQLATCHIRVTTTADGTSSILYLKYLCGIYSVSSTELLPRAPVSVLRGHDYKLTKRHCRTHARLSFFSFRVVSAWNSLPSDVVSAPSLNTFKGRLDKYWGHHCYCLDPSLFVRRQVNSQQVTLA